MQASDIKVTLIEVPPEDWSIRGIPASEVDLGFKISVWWNGTGNWCRPKVAVIMGCCGRPVCAKQTKPQGEQRTYAVCLRAAL